MTVTAAACTSLALQQIILRRRLLRDDAAWQSLYDTLRDAYTRAWTAQARAGIAAALDVLRDLGPGAYTAADGALLLTTLRAELGADAMEAALRGPTIRLTDALWRLGAREVATAAGIDIRFLQPDLDALAKLKQGNLHWIGNTWNAYVGSRFENALTTYFVTGMTREQLAEQFAEDFAGLTEKTRHYWELLADHTATKTREIGRVTGYERAAASYVQVRAQIDDNTTPICRSLHGRLIPVSTLSAQRNKYIDAAAERNFVAAKAAWTMHAGTAEVPAGAPLPEGTASPPYHFRCRTITVMWFGAPPGVRA